MQPLTGIYFLCQRMQVVYVGQARAGILKRVGRQAFDQKGKFDSIFYVPAPAEKLDDLEARLIAALVPKLNIKLRRSPMPDDHRVLLDLQDPNWSERMHRKLEKLLGGCPARLERRLEKVRKRISVPPGLFKSAATR